MEAEKTRTAEVMMREMPELKWFKPLVSFALLFVICFLFYFPVNNPIMIKGITSRILGTQSNAEYNELATVLKRASMVNKTVIITTLNEAWAVPGSVMDLFLESFRIGEGTKVLLNYLLIVAVDHKSFEWCKSIHPHCYSLTTPGVDFASEKRFMTLDYLKLMWRRIDFLRTVLELGYNFAFTDADVMWLRDPFPHFTDDAEISIACDYYQGNPTDRNNKANGGFNFVKSNLKSIEFYKYWYKSRVQYPNSHDQSVFEMIKNDKNVITNGLKIRYLDTSYFGGFCQPSKDMNKVCTMHANCCVGIEKKLHDLRLVLEDWRNFTALPTEKRRLVGSSAIWRAPSECKIW
ncbi:uncharacterized protein At4g15970-like [Macadamia integrifolia]|uniref:uncharacterized protein At4g15970-like n=1 Tax=Macadamia integrifolia TaxID=60698 RepID=UPI001C500E00|nr:uncharacterized protein At4g15970-like [Macadamia integrifolia]